ncbi:MAG: ABC transporter ATP-binding protein [Acidimicrobiia bacterium]
MAMPNTFHKFLYLIGRRSRFRWLIVIGLAVVAGGLEMVGALLVFLVLAMVVDPGATLALPVIGELPGLETGDRRLVLLTTAGIAAFFVIRAAVRIGQTYLQQRVVHKAAAALSKRLVTGYLTMPYSFHLQRNSAELIRNANEIPPWLASQVFLPVVTIVAESILLVGLVIVLVVTSPLATGLALAFMAPTVYLLARVVQPRLKELGRLTHDMAYRALSTLQQSLGGVRDIKVLHKEIAFARQYGRSRDSMAHAQYQLGTTLELPRTLIESALLLFILAYFGFTISRGTAVSETLPVLGLFAYAGLRIQPSLQAIVRSFNNLKFATAALDNVYADLVMLDRADLQLPAQAALPLPFQNEIVLEGVGHRYAESDREAVLQVSLRIRRGDFVGICGPTGGGKTTLVDLVTGLLEPTSGVIWVDGQNIAEHMRRWQANLGVVPQDVFLMDDSLRRNIALGVGDDLIDDQAVDEAVRLAQLDDFVASLPGGLDTWVGEHGVRLSGGQRQRVAIARALYRRPDVLVFDEGTSALDNVTEAQLVEMLEHVRGERTIIVVAHRLSSVRACDYIVFVDGGNVIAVAPFSELIEMNSTFREMAART